MRLAKKDTIGVDGAGVRRQYLEGDQVPDGIEVPAGDVREVEDTNALGGVTSGTDAPGGDDRYVEDGSGVRRLVKAGDELPGVTTDATPTLSEEAAAAADEAQAESAASEQQKDGGSSSSRRSRRRS